MQTHPPEERTGSDVSSSAVSSDYEGYLGLKLDSTQTTQLSNAD